jgi:hypothetical protein
MKPERVLWGDLALLGFTELVEFLNVGRRTGDLVVRVDSTEAGVSFESGDVRGAWFGKLSSKDAFFALARVGRGTFEFLSGPPTRRNIDQPTMALLVELRVR